MNDLEKLIYLHDRTGSAKTFLLTPVELHEMLDAAHELGFERTKDIFQGA